MAAKKPPPDACSTFENAFQQSAHCHQLDTANMQTDYANERHGLGFLLQNSTRTRSRSSAASIAPVGPGRQ
jgi:hypothetical protein